MSTDGRFTWLSGIAIQSTRQIDRQHSVSRTIHLRNRICVGLTRVSTQSGTKQRVDDPVDVAGLRRCQGEELFVTGGTASIQHAGPGEEKGKGSAGGRCGNWCQGRHV